MSDETTNLAEVLSEERLLHLLRSTEHDFVERKPKKQQGEWLQTAVAFANSAPIDHAAVLFVGADDAGNPQFTETEEGKSIDAVLEEQQKSINGVLDRAYPPIKIECVPLKLGKSGCIAVIIRGSRLRPHFAGKSYIRKGPSNHEASEAQFALLLAERNSKFYEIRKLLGSKAVLEQFKQNYTGVQGRRLIKIMDCNSHYLTYEDDQTQKMRSAPMDRLAISFDHAMGLPIVQTWEP
jgi:predicted HTH transcriptional regulator